MMKRLALLMLIFLALASSSFSDNTHNTGNPQKELGAWFGQAMSPFIASNCLPAVPSSSLTMAAFACSGYVQDSTGALVYVTQAAAAITLANTNGTHWLAISHDTSSVVSGWSRRAGSHYLFRQVTAQPANPTGGLVFAKVTVAGGVITALSDYRIPASYVKSHVYDMTDPLYGGACDGTSADGTGTDNTPAWNLAVATLKNTGGILFVPHGFCHFASQPAPLQNGITVRGEGMDVTYLVRAYTEANVSQGFIDMDLANTSDVSNIGGGVEQLSLWAKTGTTGGSGIDMDSSATAAQGRITIDRIRISGTGTWNYGVRADGSANNTGTPGIRGIVVRHAYIFQAATINLLLLAVNHALIDQVFLASGAATAALAVDGGTGGGAVQSNDISIVCEFCPVVTLGTGVATQSVFFSTSYTTTLTIGSFLTLFTMTGSIGTLVGTYTPAAPASTGPGYMTQGKGLFGVSGPTTDGGHLETSDGITFPATQVPSTNVNTLDDYEEGVFTPTIVSTGTPGTTTYTTQLGFYQKVGRYVHVDINLVWTGQTGASNLIVQALPFGATTETGYVAPCGVVYSNLVVGAGLQLVAYVVENSTTILLRASDPAGGAFAALAIDTAGTLLLSCRYRTTQ